MHLENEGVVKRDQLIDVESSDRSLLIVRGMKSYTGSGTIGFGATPNKGKVHIDALASEISETVKDFLKG